MKISIIIPLYNVSEFVAKAASSITACDKLELIEVIAVDDGSTDDSLDICIKNLQGINTKAIKQTNKGLSAARNTGIKAAEGEYILFLDADDFLLPRALENIIKSLDTSQSDVLFGRYIKWNPKRGFSKQKPFIWNPPEDPKKRTEYILDALPEHSWNVWRYICKREFIIENNLYFEEGLLCEDVPWTLAMLEAAKSISFLPEPFYAYYHRRQDSIMNNKNPQRFIDLNIIIARLCELYKQRPIIYKRLIMQSFLSINEYCSFNKKDRKRLWESYKCVLPIYKNSISILHKIAGRCQVLPLFYIISIIMFLAKCIRKGFI